ncbi:MAG: bifunctional serine/threonine-protein kinase/formylglycine-generating enzyme family protein [Proteobacteria bacterium]|nr:bifunctional serine/threonine-protein kinase/formylglycine-generating enzyme family protein [Pseudomonadota bacterium]
MSNQKCRFCLKVNPPGSRYCNFCGGDLAFAILPDGLLPPGTVLRGSYAVENVLGEGGMGVVYACHHKTLATRYALKVLDPKLARMDLQRSRFLSEAKIQASIVHPHIVRVLDVIDSDKDSGVPGILAIVMEYIHGEALDRILEKGPLSERDAVSTALVMLDAIGYAHHAGIVHRDLKPSNVMVCESLARESFYMGVKVMDFGIAKVLEEREQRTSTGMRMGTPHYMAPEQIENARQVDERTDLYAIGLTLYELLCGRTPFSEYREFELMKAQLTMRPPSMRNFRRDISDRLEAIVMKSLEKDRSNRYQNAESFQRALLSLGGYDEISLRLNPYEGTTPPLLNQKLQRKIEKAIDRTKAKPLGEEAPEVAASSPETRPKTARSMVSSGGESAPRPTKRRRRFSSTQSAIASDGEKNAMRGEEAAEKGLVPRKETSSAGTGQARIVRDGAGPRTDVGLAQRSRKRTTEAGAQVKAVAPSPKRTETGFGTAGRAAKTAQSASAPKRTSRIALKLVLVLLLALVVAGLYYRSQRKMPQPVPVPVTEAPPAETAQRPLPEDVSALPLQFLNTETGRMTLVPAAKHWISTQKRDEIRQVALDAFYIDQVEVSYHQYLKCVDAGKCPPLGAEVPDLNWPVTGIGLGSAEAFCAFAGKKLPTAEQWEAAARFGGQTNGITYVEVNCQNIHFGALQTSDCKKYNPNHPENVFARVQSSNPGHILNMLGNVREWTSTPSDTSAQKAKTKGGSYRSPKAEISISASQDASLNEGAPDLGFRCIR